MAITFCSERRKSSGRTSWPRLAFFSLVWAILRVNVARILAFGTSISGHSLFAPVVPVLHHRHRITVPHRIEQIIRVGHGVEDVERPRCRVGPVLALELRLVLAGPHLRVSKDWLQR